MDGDLNRRKFIKNCSQIGIAACVCLTCPAFGLAGDSTENESTAAPTPEELKEALNPKNLTYCAYQCGEHCDLYRATTTNDQALKRKVYDEWGWKEQYGIEYDPEQVFCYGCKTVDKPKNIVLQKCTVRACAIERKLDSCIQCARLADCEKELWTKFPQHRESVLGFQKKYVELYGVELI